MYLVAMSVTDILEMDYTDIKDKYDFSQTTNISIPDINDKNYIGVIDTPFDSSVFFSEWVESKNMVDENIPIL